MLGKAETCILAAQIMSPNGLLKCLRQGSFAPGKSRHVDHRGEIRATETRLRCCNWGRPPEAIQTLADITMKGPPGARVSAAVVLLDRAYGKAPTFSTSDTQAFKRAIDMTDDELAAIASGAPRFTLVKSG